MWDVFISHASEDKEIARPLAVELRTRGLRVWYDESALQLGDSLRRSIEDGLTRCRYGIVILSKNFFAKEWPQRELDGLIAREISGTKVILPVWHRITRNEVASYSPVLVDRVAANTDAGILAVAEQVAQVITRADEHRASSEGRSNARRLSKNAELVLRYTLEQSISRWAETPDADEVMTALGLSAHDYADAVEELAHLDLVRAHGNANHESGYVRATLRPQALVEFRHFVDDADIRGELEQLIVVLQEKGRDRASADYIMESVSTPIPRLELLIRFLEETGLADRGGPGSPATLSFRWAQLTPAGRRVAQALDTLPVINELITRR